MGRPVGTIFRQQGASNIHLIKDQLRSESLERQFDDVAVLEEPPEEHLDVVRRPRPSHVQHQDARLGPAGGGGGGGSRGELPLPKLPEVDDLPPRGGTGRGRRHRRRES